ncbi:MAG: FecR domain-containing protein, partial [Anaerolineae bacterium]|nr:FecR domain-containing protein [Anaerolineae bacterium]
MGSIRLLMIALVAAIVLLAPALSSTQPAMGQPDAVARITPVQGLVQHRADTDLAYEWETLTEDAFLYEGDWVQTDHAGLAEVVFFEGNFVEILPDSLLQVEEFAFEDEDSPVVVIDLSVGDILTEIDHRLDNDSRYEVHTPTAVVSVRGTRFFTTVTWQAETIINHETGTLAVSGVAPDGTISPPILISTTQQLPITSDGAIGEPGPFNPPDYPP